MDDGPPTLIAIDRDDHHAEFVGRAADGRQFFLTTPFTTETATAPRREFVALYLFDDEGSLIEAKIDDLGPHATLDHAKRESIRDTRLRELGEVSFERIEIAPFAVERFGTTFGLIVREPEDEEDAWAAIFEPGDFMAFFAPWDSGIYDT
jgi:hypothetical protein